MKKIRYISSFITVRPIRWFFANCIRSSFGPTFLPRINSKFEREFCGWIQWPNFHWWLAYKTVFRFFDWLHYSAWRPFCKWGKNGRMSYPPIAQFIHWIGNSTAGQAIGGGHCYHCNAVDCDTSDLSDDETGETFILERTYKLGTMDGTDHRFSGTTICPKCGYRQYIDEGSL